MSKSFNEAKRLFNQARQHISGGDEQVETEINEVCNLTYCQEMEEYVQKQGFTLLVCAIRKFYADFRNANAVEFAYKLTGIIASMMEGRQPESDGGKRAREFVAKSYPDFR